MNIDTLKLFKDVAELKSFSRAAERNSISQSAVSQQLAQMELMHRCQLVDRKKRPIELTRQGELFYLAARDIIDRYDQFRSELNSLIFATTGRINVAAIFSIGMHTLPDFIKKMMVRYPEVKVHVEYLSSSKIYEQVLTGEIDIGLLANPRRDRHLDVYDFQLEPLVLVCNPVHPLAANESIEISALQFERFIAFEQTIPTRHWIDDIFKRYALEVNPVMEFDNIETIKRAIEINTGVSILPRIAIELELSAGTLKAIELSNEKFTRPTGVIVRKNKVLSRPAKYFIKLLRNEIANQ